MHMKNPITAALAAACCMIAPGVAAAQQAVPDPFFADQGSLPEPAPVPATMGYGLDAQTASQVQMAAAADEQNLPTFNQDEIVNAAETFFGETSTGLARAVRRVFSEQGEPTGYIEGNEVAGALGAGVRYGKGTLVMRDGERREVFWQGPSIGFDTGASASKVFTLVYNLGNPSGIYRRYPGVEGAAFLVAGVSVTYQRAEDVTLAPIRTGVGLRAGVNTGYTAYSMRRRWLPF